MYSVCVCLVSMLTLGLSASPVHRLSTCWYPSLRRLVSISVTVFSVPPCFIFRLHHPKKGVFLMMRFERDPIFFLINVTLPVFLIASCSLASFLINDEDPLYEAAVSPPPSTPPPVHRCLCSSTVCVCVCVCVCMCVWIFCATRLRVKGVHHGHTLASGSPPLLVFVAERNLRIIGCECVSNIWCKCR